MLQVAKTLAGVGIILLLAFFMAWEGISAYRRGYIRQRYSWPRVERDDTPFTFWMATSFYVVVALVLAFIAGAVVIRLFQ
jgi:hypothetical protein